MAAGIIEPAGADGTVAEAPATALLLHPILDLFLRVIAGMSLLVAATAAVLGPLRTVVAAAANAALNLFLLWRLRRGHSTGVAFLSSLALLVVSLHAIARGSGIHDVGMVVVAVLMMLSALLERRWQALVIILGAGAGVWLVGTAEVQGWFPFDDDVPPGWDDVVVVTILLLAAAILMRAVVAGVRTGLIELQRSQERRRRLEEDLRHAERLRALGELVGGVAHDFNNQLTGVLGGVELLRRELPGNPTLIKYVDDIGAAAERAADLTRQLLATARRAEPRRQKVDLAALAEDVITLLRRTLPGNIRVLAEQGPGSFSTIGDPSLLHSALLNLGVNARDAMPAGGSVTFRLERRSVAPDEASSLDLRPGPHLELSVSDTGTGMDGETLSRIFDPFFTTKKGGTGLGLAAAYGTLRAHGGALTATSTPSRGSCFRLLLPALDPGQAEAADPPARLVAPSSGLGT
jgi:signal transduction histidine kinase